MRQFDLIVFDMDGVLTDSTSCHSRAYSDLWSRTGIANPPAYETIAGRATAEVVREYTAGLDPAPAEIRAWTRWKQERAREYLQKSSAFPDALPALETLSSLGFHLALGTGASAATARMLLNQGGLDVYLPVIVTADDVSRGKPHPETYARAITLSAGTPEKSLVVEDSASGLVAGAAAGAWTASVRSGEQVDDPNFIGIFPDLGSLLTVITGQARVSS
ncbi:MAG: HAD family phosphatase [Gemmatimonadota bacterium]